METPASDGIQIKTLPRPSDKPAAAGPQAASAHSSESRLFAIFGFVSLAFAIGLVGVWWHSRTEWIKSQSRQIANTAVDPETASINRSMYNTHMKEEMMKRRLLIENQQTWESRKDHSSYVLPEISNNYGVQMDQENSAERVYKDLYGDTQKINGVNLDDKVNSLLANRKWLNELDRAERVTFIRNFIRAAYDRGWEVQLDQNLVVTGVRRITEPKQVNIEQVLNKLAQKGE